MRISAPAADACLLIHPFIRAFAACVRSIDQFSLNQHVMTSTGLLTEQEMQKKVVDELQASMLRAAAETSSSDTERSSVPARNRPSLKVTVSGSACSSRAARGIAFSSMASIASIRVPAPICMVRAPPCPAPAPHWPRAGLPSPEALSSPTLSPLAETLSISSRNTIPFSSVAFLASLIILSSSIILSDS